MRSILDLNSIHNIPRQLPNHSCYGRQNTAVVHVVERLLSTRSIGTVGE